MTLKPDASIPRFLQAAQVCNGQVWFNTPEGDKLNLKSALSRFVFTAVLAGDLQKPAGCIRLENPEDLPTLSPFLQEDSQ